MASPTTLTIIYDNPIDDALEITASSEVPTMPVSMLRTQRRSDIFRTTGCAEEWVSFSFSRPMLPDFLGLVNHNLPTGTIRLQLNDIDDFNGDTIIDETFTSAPAYIYGAGDQPFGAYGFGGTAGNALVSMITRAISPPQIYFFNAPLQAVLFGKITFLDPVNTDGFIKLGRLYVAESLRFLRHYDLGSTVECIDPSTIIRTPDGPYWPDKHAKYFQRTINLGRITSAERYYQLMNFWLTVGQTDPFIIVLDPTTAETMQLTSHYARLVEDPRITDRYAGQHEISLKFEEVR